MVTHKREREKAGEQQSAIRLPSEQQRERGAKSGLIDQIPRAQNGLFGVRAADLRHQPRPGNQWSQRGELSV